ncbi:uncharacterized protein LOC113666300 [Pocillopora damicornis]|uniref:uncharacterized protein LOC113666300 n=1 Tax=Pocillopora damicornis TaxID=46731 RepID=UPI000F54FBBD|nr:uncharacterized protein LOC113666300 [Pocillopora damicornis]
MPSIFGVECVLVLLQHLTLQKCFPKCYVSSECLQNNYGNFKKSSGRVKSACFEIVGSKPLSLEPRVLAQGATSNHHIIELERYLSKTSLPCEESKPVRSQEHTALLNKLTSVESIMKERLLTLPFEEQEMKSKLTDIIDRE